MSKMGRFAPALVRDLQACEQSFCLALTRELSQGQPSWWMLQRVTKTPAEIQKVNRFVNDIFAGHARPDGRPILQADFGTGRYQPIPRTLLKEPF